MADDDDDEIWDEDDCVCCCCNSGCGVVRVPICWTGFISTSGIVGTTVAGVLLRASPWFWVLFGLTATFSTATWYGLLSWFGDQVGMARGRYRMFRMISFCLCANLFVTTGFVAAYAFYGTCFDGILYASIVEAVFLGIVLRELRQHCHFGLRQ